MASDFYISKIYTIAQAIAKSFHLNKGNGYVTCQINWKDKSQDGSHFAQYSQKISW